MTTTDSNAPTPDAESKPEAPPPAAAPTRRSAMLQGFVILVSGIVLGVAGTLLWTHYCRPHGGRSRGKPDPTRLAACVQERLGLDTATTDKVKAVFEKHVERMNALRQTIHPMIEAGYNQLKADMQGVLTAEQYTAWLKSFEERHKRGHGRRSRRHDAAGTTGN